MLILLVTLLNYPWYNHTTVYLNLDCPFELPSMRGSQGCRSQYAWRSDNGTDPKPNSKYFA